MLLRKVQTKNLNRQIAYRSDPLVTTFLLYILSVLAGDVDLAIHYLAHFLMLFVNYITMARGRRGFGGGMGGESAKIKALLVVIVLVLVIPAIALVFSGPTTAGGSGVYGNSTVSAGVRNGTVSFSQFIGIIMIVGAVIVLVGMLG